MSHKNKTKPKLFRVTLIVVSFIVFTVPTSAQMREPGTEHVSLTQSQASHFAQLALKCITREYPNKPEHVLNDSQDVQNPKALHPAFYGCYDWHSSIHGHWMLVRLLRLFPNVAEAPEIRKAISGNLSEENLRVETAYLKQKNRQSFERTYGWAWLLKLAEEVSLSSEADAKTWSRNLQPLAEALANSYLVFLPKQTYPIRTGVHPNTAFGLAFAFDYAKTSGNEKLATLIAERSRTYFANDRNYPGAWEPGGEDFFSPALMEADLMRRVLKPAEFRRWFDRFLPQLASGQPQALLKPATVTDRSDPKLVHLDGLNLSRAWCMRSIANALPRSDTARKTLANSARAHASDALAHVASGDYAGEHWLASFAVYLLSTPEP
ncbi:MAG TPA: DUF2891 domain-containing protein [Pyrinomonadaceae bacterium]|nr:DUF2891 domain-containing protein [Pyrinomonadaceae bacterium]